MNGFRGKQISGAFDEVGSVSLSSGPSTQSPTTKLQPLQADLDDSSSELLDLHDDKPSGLIMILTFVSSISGFMFGYDTGYISAALMAIGTDLDGKELTYGEKEIITAATSLGALIFATVAGLAGDYFGRKPTLMFANVLFIVGAVLQVATHTFWEMAAGRLIMGFGIGIGSLLAPLFIGEIAPSKFRGRLVVINVGCITGGQLIAYSIGAGLVHVNNGWRILVGLSIIPPLIQFITFFFLPDTPRFYLMKGNVAKAREVMRKTHAGAPEFLLDAKVDQLAHQLKSVSGGNLFTRTVASIKKVHSVTSNLRGLIIACGLQGVQQFTGFNALMYFSGTVFQAVGFNNSTAVSILVAGTSFLFTIVAFLIIDKVGRRRLLMFGLPGMVTSLVVCAIGFHFLGIKFEGSTAVLKNGNDGISAWGIVIVVGMILFVATYAVGIGNVPWQQSELFPQDVRGIGLSYATATNWAGSLVISSTFLTMLQHLTPTGTFSFFAALSFISWIAVYFCYPELSGLELEETQDLLKGGFNIKESIRLAKERKLLASKKEEMDTFNGRTMNDIEGGMKPSEEFIEDTGCGGITEFESKASDEFVEHT